MSSQVLYGQTIFQRPFTSDFSTTVRSILIDMSAQPRRGGRGEIFRHGYNAGNKNTTGTRPVDSRQVRSRDYPRERKRLRSTTRRHFLTHPSEASGVEVVYTIDVLEAENWLRVHITACAARVVGFDIEWKPQFVSKRDGGTENPTAVLQLGVETSCLVLHIYHMSELPRSLTSILGDENILKVGVGIEEDALKLTRHRGLVCKGMVDIQKMVQTTKCKQQLGLKTLAQRFLGIELEKSKRVTRSNWENFPLTKTQTEYAALDAWAGVKIYHAIVQYQQRTSAQYNNTHSVSHHQATSPQSPGVYDVLAFILLILVFFFVFSALNSK